MKKYSTKSYYNYAKRMLEGEASATSDIDPDIKKLFKAVEGLESKTPGSAEKFMELVQNKYGIKSVKDMKKIPMWLKVSEVVIIGGPFIGEIVSVIAGAILFVGGIATLDATFVGIGAALGIVSAFTSFVFYKIVKSIMAQPTTESFNPNNIKNKKMIVETKVLNRKIFKLVESMLVESDASAIAKSNAVVTKADGICSKMFAWIKEKFMSAVAWVKKHPWLVISTLIIIGFVFLAARLHFLNKAAEERMAQNMKDFTQKYGEELKNSVRASGKETLHNIRTGIDANANIYAGMPDVAKKLTFSQLEKLPADSIANTMSKMPPAQRAKFWDHLMNINSEKLNSVYDALYNMGIRM